MFILSSKFLMTKKGNWPQQLITNVSEYLIKSEISLCFNYTFCSIIIGEKRLRQQSKDPRTPPSHQPEAVDTPSPRPRPPNDLEGGEVKEGCEVSSPPSEFLVVEGQATEPFTTDSAQRLIGQIMLWNGQIDKMRDQIHSMQLRLDSMQQEMKNMIDALGRI
ncbi:hypothetical protein AB205_0024280 [Aquarana catesbeiana]|uniref:Uncharacterized protein n=1 Tax=Aquarana catesbeiana TaxID=8400 RepID=A0A2G9QHY2_AQUCT|nr:hypothetical protein AB205_0024280 [Aquarana catesbeiana]